MSIKLNKELLAVEDIYFGFGTSVQHRGTVNLFNAAYLPYSVSQSVTHAIDSRPTLSDADIRYAAKAGSASQVFDVAPGVTGTDAVNFNQLKLKADITEVDLKAYKTNVLEKTNSVSYIPLTDYNPATKRYVDEAIINKFALGATGTFTSKEGKIITVSGGLITGIA
jgi:hypothetical protein